jgi:hypothetical protein
MRRSIASFPLAAASSLGRTRRASIFFSTLAVLSLSASAVPAEVIDLTQGQIGSPLASFDFWRSSRLAPQDWSVVRDGSADGHLAIRNAGAGPDALAAYRPLSVVNVTAKIRFKLLGGKRPTAGIAVRFVDPQNYYVVRADAFGGRLSFDHVVAGKAEEIAGVETEIFENHWQTLEIVANGDSFAISLDGAWAVTAFERSPQVGGKIALWSDQDSTTLFDSIEIAPLPAASGGNSRDHGAGG